MTNERYKQILSYIRRIIRATRWEGHVYAVGGCCRDFVLGREVNDIDLAVDIPDGGVRFAMWAFRRHRTLGRPVLFPRFGTARLRFRKFPDCEIELVQTRKEKYTDKNSRCPEVAFGSVEEDCWRRDFTINTLYYNISTDTLLDITGHALDDIRNRIIRTPLNPDSTFDDDPVRIYRAIRFSSRFNWDITPDTLQGMMRNVDRLEIVSPNRAKGELLKMLHGSHPSRALKMLDATGVLKYLIPELEPLKEIPQYLGSNFSVWDHTLRVLDSVADEEHLRMAALLHDVGKAICSKNKHERNNPYPCHDSSAAPLVKRIMRRLNFDTPFIAIVKFLVIHHMRLKKAGAKSERLVDKKLLKLFHTAPDAAQFEMLLNLIHADNISQDEEHALPMQVPAIKKRIQNLELN